MNAKVYVIYCSAARHWSNVMRDTVAQAFIEARRDAMAALVSTFGLDIVKDRVVCTAALCYPDGLLYTADALLPLTIASIARDFYLRAIGIPRPAHDSRRELDSFAVLERERRDEYRVRPKLFRRGPAGIIHFDPLASEMVKAGAYYALADLLEDRGDIACADAMHACTDTVSAVSALLGVPHGKRLWVRRGKGRAAM